jgi:hypothetical protein
VKELEAHVSNSFREFLFPLDHPRLATFRGMNPRDFAKAMSAVPQVRELIGDWPRRAAEHYNGITCDGHCEHGLYPVQQEGAPTASMVAAAEALLSVLDEASRARLRHPIDATEWRKWSNPEFLINDHGLRLDDLDERVRNAVLAVMEASLSAQGYALARDCMRMNAFLGELTHMQSILNEWSYNFLLFGEPSATAPWGWSLYGHHLALNCFVCAGQMVISPVFMGAEPNLFDAGPYAGKRLFDAHEKLGLAFMRTLDTQLRAQATIYTGVDDPKVPAGRITAGDQWHVGGAFHDNAIVPYEGVAGAALNASQRKQLMDLAAVFLDYLPSNPRQHKLQQIERHLDRTHWSWCGRHGDDDPFYYRIQSPVTMLEFDHHAGIWLTNQQPAKCHIHTVIRTPNGNDYGKDLLRQHYEQTHPGRAPGRA